MAHMAWVLDYGRDWPDLAILEVEAALDGVVVPKGGSGKVRAPALKVIREVPLEECGIYAWGQRNPGNPASAKAPG